MFLLIIIYLAFISLGLPDSLLGATWPVMQPGLHVPFSFAGFASMMITGGTIVSSLLSGRVIERFGTARVTLLSVTLTAAALLGFSLAPSFVWIVALAVPLGLGGGAVDSGLNGYVAEHYEARHMSWLHCLWGVGATTGPMIMAGTIAHGQPWRTGYLIVSLVQFAIAAMLLLSLPLWAGRGGGGGEGGQNGSAAALDGSAEKRETLGLFFPLQIRGVRPALAALLFYCGIEATVSLWGSSYLVRVRGLEAGTAAAWIAWFFGSITLGRFFVGFLTNKVRAKTLVRGGALIVMSGAVLLFLPLPASFALAGFVLIGLGCAPVFPSMLHETPGNFGKQNAQHVIGFQMAAGYVGATFLPPVFGFVADSTSLGLLPLFILAYTAIMLVSTERLSVAIKVRPDRDAPKVEG